MTVSVVAEKPHSFWLLLGELAPRGRDDVGACVGVALESPTALGRLRDENPGTLGHLGIASGGRNDIGELLDDAELLVAIENADRREDLDADVVAVAGDVGQ